LDHDTNRARLAGVKDREISWISAAVVERTDRQTLRNFVEDRVIDGATVYIDEHSAYQGMPFHEHESVSHRPGRHNAREPDTEQQMKAVVRGMVGRRLRYPDSIS